MVCLTGEALVGEGKEIAHIDLVIGERGSAVEQAFMSSLANPQKGHSPLFTVLAPNLPAKPWTLMVNKVTIKNAKQATLIFGPAQAAVAKAVVDSVAEGVIPKAEVDDLYLIVSVFLEWDAEDKDKVYKYNYEATKQAISNAYKHQPSIDDILSKKDSIQHPFR